MKAAYVLRFDYKIKSGGDSMKIEKYCEYMVSAGVNAKIFTNLEKLRNFRPDIVHLCNIDLPIENLIYANYCVENKIPYVISSIHHPDEGLEAYYKFSEYDKFNRITRGLRFPSQFARESRERLRLLAAGEFRSALVKSRFDEARKFIIENAALVFPMTYGELLSIEKEISIANFKVIPNPFTFDISESDRILDRHGILTVGRIEPRKNQIMAIKIAKISKKPIKIVGKFNKNHPKYTSDFLNAVSDYKYAEYIPHMNRDELKKIYESSKILLSASWFEVVSQVDLEAIATGMMLMSTKWGYTKDYLHNKIPEYNPMNFEESLNGLMEIDRNNIKPLLKDDLRLGWNDIGRQLLDCYRGVL